MVKQKTFHLVVEAFPKKYAKIAWEVNYDCSTLNRYIEEIGSTCVISITGLARAGSGDYTVFYEADGLFTCPDCDWDYSPDHAFCGHCGKALVPITKPELPACAHCGKPLLPTSDFCTACGQRQPEPPKKKGLFD